MTKNKQKPKPGCFQRLKNYTVVIFACCGITFLISAGVSFLEAIDVLPDAHERTQTQVAEQATEIILNITADAQSTIIAIPSATAAANMTATATLWTASPTPTITNTSPPTNTRPPSRTPQPSRTRVPNTTTYYISGSGANVRADSTTNSETVGTYRFSDEIRVIETVEGQLISGSTTWYQIWYANERAYIHSSLVSRNRPSTAVPQSVAPQSVAPQPAEPQAVAPQSPYTCNCSRTCGAMTCEEAYFQLNQCGCSRRDGDSDGVPCESICPGG